MNIILLGPPGAGKGTQAALLAAQLGMVHLSTGALFRQHMLEGTPLGNEARAYVEKGKYVPDHITVAMVREELAKSRTKQGVVFDGFPRTLEQARALDDLLQELGQTVNLVLELVADPEVIVRRAAGRRLCPNGHTYHVESQPPKQAGVCDVCGLPLTQRADDRRETVLTRIRVYEEQTRPLTTYYAKRGILQQVNAAQPIKQVAAEILQLVQRAEALHPQNVSST